MILLKVTLQNAYLACNYVPIEALPLIHWRYFTPCLHVLLYVLLPRLPFYDGSLGKGLVHTIIQYASHVCLLVVQLTEHSPYFFRLHCPSHWEVM